MICLPCIGSSSATQGRKEGGAHYYVNSNHKYWAIYRNSGNKRLSRKNPYYQDEHTRTCRDPSSASSSITYIPTFHLWESGASSIFNFRLIVLQTRLAYVRIRTYSEDLGSCDQHTLLSQLNGALQVFHTWFVLTRVQSTREAGRIHERRDIQVPCGDGLYS